MTNYYQTLNLSPSATTRQIEAAIDHQYNKWRRLVTHHDPNIAHQANQALRLLQDIRGTLTNPAKREVYDKAIGLRGTVGGLADPEALLTQVATYRALLT